MSAVEAVVVILLALAVLWLITRVIRSGVRRD